MKADLSLAHPPLAADRRGAPVDDRTIAEWVDVYAGRLYRAAVLMSTEAEAPDLCQEVFLIAARKRDAFDGTSSPYTWLYGILRNLARDRRRRLARRAGRPLRLVPDDAVVADPEVHLNTARDRASVREAVARLPEPQREVITLFYLDELPVAEVATRLGLAEGTVKSRLFRARDALKRALRRTR